MAILDFGKDRWLSASGWTEDEVSALLVLEGTWWHVEAGRTGLARPGDVAGTSIADMETSAVAAVAQR